VPQVTARYDGLIVEGVKRFQIRHGLEPDGVLGMSTITALGVPLAWRVCQIELALERLRWLPHVDDERLIAVNIPMFRLWTWDTIPPDGMPLCGMDVIVGRALRHADARVRRRDGRSDLPPVLECAAINSAARGLTQDRT
jgi:murein L,D-transpeptidase YcbB/YkuD